MRRFLGLVLNSGLRSITLQIFFEVIALNGQYNFYIFICTCPLRANALGVAHPTAIFLTCSELTCYPTTPRSKQSATLKIFKKGGSNTEEVNAPYQVTFDGITYTQMSEDGIYIERYTSDSPTDTNTYTVHQIMTRHFSSYWRKSAKKISCPAIFYELSASLRLKILKIVENHFYPPNPLPDGNLIPFFSHYEEYTTKSSQVQREYNACLFAANYDDEAAAALLLENGFDYHRENSNAKCTNPSLVSITYNDEGIYLHFDKPTTDINSQLESAYEKMYNNFQLQLNRLYSKMTLRKSCNTSS